MTAWNDFVIQFAKKNKITYGCALADPRCSVAYHKSLGRKDTEATRARKEKIFRDIKRKTEFETKIMRPENLEEAEPSLGAPKKVSIKKKVQVEPLFEAQPQIPMKNITISKRLVEAEPEFKPKGLKVNRFERLVEAEPSLKPKNITIQKRKPVEVVEREEMPSPPPVADKVTPKIRDYLVNQFKEQIFINYLMLKALLDNLDKIEFQDSSKEKSKFLKSAEKALEVAKEQVKEAEENLSKVLTLNEKDYFINEDLAELLEHFQIEKEGKDFVMPKGEATDNIEYLKELKGYGKKGLHRIKVITDNFPNQEGSPKKEVAKKETKPKGRQRTRELTEDERLMAKWERDNENFKSSVWNTITGPKMKRMRELYGTSYGKETNELLDKMPSQLKEGEWVGMYSH